MTPTTPSPARPRTPTRPWRTVLFVLLVALVDVLMSFVVLGMGLEDGTVPQEPTAPQFLRYFFAPLLAPLAAVTLIWRHRFPVAVAAVTAVLAALFFSGMAFFVALYLLARRRLSWWVAGVIALSVGAEALLGTTPLTWDLVLVMMVLLSGVAGWGAYRGQRARAQQERVAALQQRAEHAEAERAAESERSKLAERHRIAREMHDTLAHRMSLVAVQAAALQVDAPDAETAAAARVIRQTAHTALSELRDVLGVLQDPAGTAPAELPVPAAPPSVAQLPALIEQWRAAGLVIDATVPAELAAELPDAVGRAAFRLVQEGLTNVARHAPDAPATVTLELHPEAAADGGELHVSVANGPSASSVPAAVGAGVGLVGLAERIGLLGGTLEHGPVAGDRATGFLVTARIPVTCPEPNS